MIMFTKLAVPVCGPEEGPSVRELPRWHVVMRSKSISELPLQSRKVAEAAHGGGPGGFRGSGFRVLGL